MSENQKQRFLHRNMAIFGGFLAAYAVLLRADFLGNAQTANLLYLVLAVIGNDFKSVILRLIGWIIYFVGGFLFVLLVRKTKLNVQIVSILIDIAVTMLLGFIPENANYVVGLYPIFFAMAFQWNAFAGSHGYSSATIFSTNNTRQVSLALGEFVCDRDKEHLKRAWFFLGTLICFHIGIILSYFLIKEFSVQAAWFGEVLLAPALLVSFGKISEVSAKEEISEASEIGEVAAEEIIR